MKELIRFSLHKRFNNRSTIIFNLIVFVVIGCAFFSDGIMKVINPSFFEKEKIYVKGVEEGVLQFLNEGSKETYEFIPTSKSGTKLSKEGYTVLEKKKEGYWLYSKYPLSDEEQASFQMMLESYHKEQLMNHVENQELLMAYQQRIPIENKVILKEDKIATDKSNIIFMFVTSVYFMMLSFVSGVASEVVNEKTTKTLELILTSVSAKEHFYSKLIVGWLVIVLQGIATLSYMLFFLLIRSLYDQATGLIAFVNKLHLIEMKGNNIYAVISNMDFSMELLVRMIYVLLFLLVGILLVQLLLVIISSYVTTIEEAGNIQAPFYLLFLGIYYLVLALNNPHDLSEGLGYWLSFVPLFNMLLMPCRILIQSVPLIELTISLLGSVYLCLLVMNKGSKWYAQGVLDYSCKGFIQIWKRMHTSKEG